MTVARSHVILFLVASVATCYFFFKYYWKIRMTLFPKMLKRKTTPDYYPIPHHLRRSYEKNLAKGIKIAASSKIIIASLVRDVEKNIPQIIEKVESLGKYFENYIVLIVENDSEDHTRQLLFKWREANPRVQILGCGVNNPETCKLPKTPKTIGHQVNLPRLKKMATLRNIYLDYIRDYLDPQDWPYTAIWDLDSLSVVYEDGFLHSLGAISKNQDVGVVCANGIYQWGAFTYFYDALAYLEKGEVFHIDDHMAHNIRHGVMESIGERGDDFHEVDSCFSGFAIYKTPELVKSKYDLPEEQMLCEHVALHQRMNTKKVVDPSMINLVLLNE